MDRDTLIDIVKNSRTYSDVLRALGKSVIGGNSFTNLQKKLNELKIDYSHFVGRGHSKGKKYENKKVPINDYLSNKRKINSYCLKRRLIKDGIKIHKCEDCENYEWKDSLIPLELHHKDGDKFNNNLDNLILLCPNCHAFTVNYRAKNRKKITIKYKRRISEEEIIKAIQESPNTAQALKKLGLNIYGQNYARINFIREKYNLSFLKDEKVIFLKNPNWRIQERPNARKVKKRPSKLELEEMIKSESLTAIGKKFGIVDNSVRKWCKKYGIDLTKSKFARKPRIKKNTPL